MNGHRRRWLAGTAGCLALAVTAGGWGLSAPGAEEGFEPPPIEVPAGYEVELVAAPPMVRHPLMGGFDDQGRLFVTDTAGLNLRRDELEEQRPGVVRMLEDSTGDGRFDRSTVFADGLTFPRGTMWYDGALYVASPPYIWKLRDTTGDGVADAREKIIGTFGYTGNAAGMHGPHRHPSGRMFWVQGRHGHEVRGEQGELISEARSGGVFSSRLDGTDFRIHATGGMDNPVGLTFTEVGDVVGNANLMFASPRGDTLVHWVHGGVYPRQDFVDRFDEHTVTGDLLPYAGNLGHVAVSGMARQRGSVLADDGHGDLFVALFNTHRVARARVEGEGSTLTAREEDFLIGRSRDFHPTDVIVDADGSLLVIDTGGWFRIGCPTSQQARPEVRGAIYRVRREGADPPDDPRGLAMDWSTKATGELVERLNDDRPAVRDRALDYLGRGDDEAAAALAEALAAAAPQRQQLGAVWALCRIGSADARRALVRAGLEAETAAVRQAAAHAVGLLGEPAAVERLMEIVARDEPSTRREAATALGLIGDARAVPALLEALADPVDRMLEHSLIYALIEIGDVDATADGLDHEDPLVQRGALIALDGMAGDRLDAERAVGLLESPEQALRSAAVRIAGRHAAWAEPVADVLRDWLKEGELTASRRATLEAMVAAHGGDAALAEAVAMGLASEEAATATAVLRGLAAGASLVPPDDWAEGLRRLLDHGDGDVVQAAVEAIAVLETGQFDAAVQRLAGNEDAPVAVRVAALQAVSEEARLTEEGFALLSEQLAGAALPTDRLTAAGMLGRARLDGDQLYRLAESIEHVGPVELPHLLRAFAGSSDAAAGRALIAALAESPARWTVPRQEVMTALGALPAEVRAEAEDLLAELQGGRADRQQRMRELGALLDAGDAARGAAVFQAGVGACVSCHRIGDVGGSIGPDLSQIGRVRSEQDLLQAIVSPSAGFARGYEPWTVTLRDGQVRFGAIVRESGEAIHLRTADGSETAIARAEIEAMAPSPVSLMPEGLDRTMSDQQLADLISYLRSLQ